MEKEQRNRLQKATQDARKLLEEEFRSQLLQTYDIDVEKVRWAEEPGAHLQAEQRLIREKLVAWIEHKEAQINDRKEALLLALRELAFTALNRFVALKLMEARELVRPCVSGGLESAGFLEFTAVAQGLLADQESSYRLYLETIFEDVSCELRALFDPRDPASLLWPKRTALLELLEILNRPELAGLWSEDETLGWVYQYFNGDAERKQMREESSAPRNSRELAVRNQFFTPRYVVEFLTDNTLGRIWYEMRQANTGLKDRCRYLVRRPNEIWLQPGEDSPAQPDAEETLSQEELLRQPVYIPHRSLKDPREIRMLDPACGSMHFGLYAFDLYLEIYNEAWEIAQGSDEQSKQEEAFSPFVAYAAGFADKAVFLREVPKLILQHNIHGIDIDPRATQIARLTLWLRAQRAWQKQRVEVADRPPVTRSNVACAEPMPGERGLLANFVDQQFPETERGLVRELLEAIFDKMQLAGEAGSLLKIEEEIRDAIAQARREWQKLDIQQRDLFSAAELAALGKVGSSPNTEDLQSLTHNFWIDIEERIYAALRHYAKQAEDDGGLRRKLFADDAAQGFAFIDVCRKRYSAVLMNPPFGQGTERYYEELRGQYQGAHHDIYAAFVRRANQLSPLGRVGAITSRSFLSAPRLEQFRVSEVLPRISIISDFGLGVMDDAYVESAAYVLGDLSVNQFSVFDLRSSAPFHASDALLSQIENGGRPCQARHYLGLPKARILYTLPASIRRLMMHGEPFEPSAGTAREGMKSFNNDRYLRTWWEVPCSEIGVGRSWVRMAKGGGYALYYSEFPLVLNWKNSGAELQETNRQINNSTAQVRQASSYWHRPGLTYSKRSAKGFSARVLPAEFVFTSNGPAILLGAADQISPAGLLAWVNSRFVRALIQLQANFGDYSSGSIKNLPWMPSLSARDASRLDELAKDLIYRRRCLLKRLETSCAFDMQLLNTSRNSNEILGDREAWDCIESQLARSIDEIVERAYANHESEWITEVLTDKESSDLDMEAEDEEDNLDSHVESAIPGVCMGVAFGRWDIRNATGKRAAPDLPDPFASLPVCPPGQLQNAQGLPAGPEDAPATYPISISWDGILLDDPNHPLDIDRHVREVIEIICSDLGSARAQSIEQEVCEILGVNSLREWFRSPSNFFADHLKHYSKSRRQAPIYWQLSPGSGSYSVWLYYHRFTQDTLYHVLRDFVEPRIQQAERELFELEFQGALSGDAATRLQEARALLQDLRIFKAELDLVAPLWNPNLNDGVIINHAILWRITPYTPWQKKCKECWDKLVKGDYDWAHLAFHLWPERVIPKCTTDRSLAIAHGLEERLWQETNNGNWLPRQLSEADLQALIAEHSNPAVKSALDRFLAAPPPVAPVRTRASRSTRASGSSTPRRARGSAAVVDAEATRQVLLALTAAPSDGLPKAAIADLIGVEANSITAVIKQLKEGGQIDQLGERRGARYLLSEQGRAAVAADAGGEA